MSLFTNFQWKPLFFRVNTFPMKSILFSIIMLSFGAVSCAQQPAAKESSNSKTENTMNTEGLSVATLGGGCFWCVEAIFQELEGVEKVESGYSGGAVKNPAYREVCNGTTGHAEVVQVYFDPSKITYEEILEVFFTTHDPTTLNRQGADVGTQYRSVIFYHDDAQKAVAQKVKDEIAPTIWDDAIVTEISPFQSFYEAEDYHQNYFSDNPNQPYCQIVINPKVAKFRQKFADKLKKN